MLKRIIPHFSVIFSHTILLLISFLKSVIYIQDNVEKMAGRIFNFVFHYFLNILFNLPFFIYNSNNVYNIIIFSKMHRGI